MRRLGNIIPLRGRKTPTARETRGPIIDSMLIWGEKHNVPTKALTELVIVLGDHGVDFKQPK